MRALIRILVIVVVVVIAGGVAALAMISMPAPTQHVEKVIPNAQLGH